MEALTGNNLLIALIVAVAMMELINLIGKTIGTFRDWRKPAEENHGGMRMRIRKTGNQKISAAVDDAFRRKLLRLADIDDFAVRNVDFPL